MNGSIIILILQVACWCIDTPLYTQESATTKLIQTRPFQQGLDNLVKRQLDRPRIMWKFSWQSPWTWTYFSPFDFQLFADRLSVMPVPRLSAIITYAEMQAQNNDSHKNAWNEIAQRAKAEYASRPEKASPGTMVSTLRNLFSGAVAQMSALFKVIRGETGVPQSSEAFVKHAIAANVFDMNQAIDVIQRTGTTMNPVYALETIFNTLLLPFMIAKTTAEGMSEQAKDALRNWSEDMEKGIVDDSQKKLLVSTIRDTINDMVTRDISSNKAILEHIAEYVNNTL